MPPSYDARRSRRIDIVCCFVVLHIGVTMSNNAASSFRSQLSGFRWANSVQDDSAASAPASQGNVFSRSWSSVSGYIPLRNEGASREEEAYFALSVSAAEALVGDS